MQNWKAEQAHVSRANPGPVIPRFALASVCLVLALVLPCPAIDWDSFIADESKSALSYLRLPVSARVAGLGGAVSAIGDDAATGLVNPASIATAQKTRFTVSGEKLTLDRQHYFAGLLHPLHSVGSVVGMGWIQAGVSDIEKRNDEGVQNGSFGDLENTIALWYGGRIVERLYAGLAAKYHMQTLDDTKATGFGGDVGIFFAANPKLGLALAGNNLGSGFKWETGHEDKLAPGLRIGLAFHPIETRLLLSSDLDWTPGNLPQGHGGVEYNIVPEFCIRAGTQGPNPMQGSAGFGIHYRVIRIDYAFTYHQSELGHSHLASLIFEM